MPELKLLERVRVELRTKHYSRRTEEVYVNWIRRFIIFNNKRHPKDMGTEEIKSFISNLATNHHVSSSTQNQALQSILFLYKRILKKDIGLINELRGTAKIKHLPVVFSQKEVGGIIKNLSGVTKLIVSLLYGTGIRLNEALRIRVKDIDFETKRPDYGITAKIIF